MLSLEQLRKIDPELVKLPDEELEAMRADMYETAEVGFEAWRQQKGGSKNPAWSSSYEPDNSKI